MVGLDVRERGEEWEDDDSVVMVLGGLFGQLKLIGVLDEVSGLRRDGALWNLLKPRLRRALREFWASWRSTSVNTSATVGA